MMNGEGYKDPTADKAVRSAAKVPYHIREVMKVLNQVAHLCGMEVTAVRDLKSGKTWRGGESDGKDSSGRK
ncbi:MAG: hypothetical protein PHS82_06265 [Lachnospiraceae bacterium]|nr:hypothetical protein [Lachnospiraceae bacterium]